MVQLQPNRKKLRPFFSQNSLLMGMRENNMKVINSAVTLPYESFLAALAEVIRWFPNENCFLCCKHKTTTIMSVHTRATTWRNVTIVRVFNIDSHTSSLMEKKGPNVLSSLTLHQLILWSKQIGSNFSQCLSSAKDKKRNLFRKPRERS